ncbi:MAG: amino acid permease [archaeon]|nr:amino acid permease [archaeon]
MTETPKPVKKSEKQNIKLRSLIYTGLGGSIGGPIYIILGGTIEDAGGGVLISLILLGILLIILVSIYSELSLSLPILGGGYSFSKEAIGGFWGFIIGWLMWLGNITFAALSALGFGVSLSVFFPNITETFSIFSPLFGVVIIIILSVLNLRVSSLLNKIMAIFTSILIFGFLFYIIIGMFFGPITNSDNFYLSNIGWNIDILSIIVVTPILFGIFCLYEWNSAFESITARIDEIKQSKKKIPRAFLFSIILAIIIYVLVTITTLINMGNPLDPASNSSWNQISNSINPLADTLNLVTGPIGMYIIGIAGMIGTITSLQAGMQLSSRIFYAMARDGYLPNIFTKRFFSDEKSHTDIPYISILVSYFFIILGTIFLDIDMLVNISNFTILLTMSLLSFSVVILRRQRPKLKRPYTVKGFPYIPILSGIFCLLIIIPLAPSGLLLGVFLSLFGIIIYSLKIARRDRILLMLSGAKIGGAIFSIIFLFIIGFHFSGYYFVEINIILIIIVCIFSFISVYFDLVPLSLIFRQMAKRKDDNALVVSELVEIDEGRRDLAFKVALITAITMILMSIYFFWNTLMILTNNIIFDFNFFGISSSATGLIGVIIFIVNGIVLLANGLTGIFLQLELRKANI